MPAGCQDPWGMRLGRTGGSAGWLSSFMGGFLWLGGVAAGRVIDSGVVADAVAVREDQVLAAVRGDRYRGGVVGVTDSAQATPAVRVDDAAAIGLVAHWS